MSASGLKCLVCRFKTDGKLRLGIVACQACKSFFLRHSDDYEMLICQGGDNECPVGIDDVGSAALIGSGGTMLRFSCTKCRYQKCINVGMRKMGRRDYFNRNSSSSSTNSFSSIDQGAKMKMDQRELEISRFQNQSTLYVASFEQLKFRLGKLPGRTMVFDDIAIGLLQNFSIARENALIFGGNWSESVFPVTGLANLSTFLQSCFDMGFPYGLNEENMNKLTQICPQMSTNSLNHESTILKNVFNTLQTTPLEQSFIAIMLMVLPARGFRMADDESWRDSIMWHFCSNGYTLEQAQSRLESFYAFSNLINAVSTRRIEAMFHDLSICSHNSNTSDKPVSINHLFMACANAVLENKV